MRVLALLFALVSGPAMAQPAASATAALGGTPRGAESRTLHFCFEESSTLPWRNRQKVGLYFELFDEVARRLDRRFEYHPQPWPFCLSEVAAGRMDGAFAVAVSPERLAVFAFPPGAPASSADALRREDILLIRRRGSGIDVVDGRLQGHTRPIGVPEGSTMADELKRRGWPVDEVSRDHIAQLSRLARGELDGIALSAFRWAQLNAAQGPALRQLEPLPEPILDTPFFLGLSREFARSNPELAQRLWTTTREVRNSPAYRRREAAAIAEALRPRPSP